MTPPTVERRCARHFSQMRDAIGRRSRLINSPQRGPVASMNRTPLRRRPNRDVVPTSWRFDAPIAPAAAKLPGQVSVRQGLPFIEARSLEVHSAGSRRPAEPLCVELRIERDEDQLAIPGPGKDATRAGLRCSGASRSSRPACR